MHRLILAALLSSSIGEASALGQDPSQLVQRRPIGERRDFFPPWEGSGVYVFGPIRIDLNRKIELFNPMRGHRLADCSNDEFFCLTSRRGSQPIGAITHIVAPRRCSEINVGDFWVHEGVRTEVLARLERPPSNTHHFSRPRFDFYLGDESNPGIVYEYWGYEGIVAVYHGLNDHGALVQEVRGGLDPQSLPRTHHMQLVTLDRFAGCRH